MRIQTFVSVHDLRWNEYKIDFARIARAVIQAAKARRVRECNPGSCENCKFSQVGAPMKSDTEISIILTNDSEIRKLNKKYRGKDTPTNVLSFETGDSELLGDIFISFDTVIRESAGARAFVDHATHMVAHGILHLLGYDHLNDSDATKMEALEVKILAKLGIDNPYKDGADKNPDKKKSALLAICSFLLGGIASLGFAPFYLWPLTIVSVAIAYYLIFANLDRCKSVSYILSPAFCFGAGYAAASFWWVLNSIYVVPE
ncbi:MAG: rRNA maturation RNase YbeY, partial [Rickettsiales bacterium]|nr:rRNA maturation RNase YbeY [Rickettsiales bacterium]